MAGRRRHKLTLQSRAEALDAYGEATVTYTDLSSVWGSLEAVSGRERVESQQVQADVSHRIRIRYAAAYSGLTPKDRVLYGSRVFDIVAVVDKTGRDKEIEITALEQV
jgi:SPP1 family predicted phage head-tail adaptor